MSVGSIVYRTWAPVTQHKIQLRKQMQHTIMIRRGADSCHAQVSCAEPAPHTSTQRLPHPPPHPASREGTLQYPSGTADSRGKSCTAHTQGSIVFLRAVEGEGLEHDTCSDQEEEEDRRRGVGEVRVFVFKGTKAVSSTDRGTPDR